MKNFLEFEKPIYELERKISELKQFSETEKQDLTDEIDKLRKKAERLQKEIYSKLSDWQKTQLSRHPERPYALDYIHYICRDFIELHGDRNFSDDKAVIGGLATLEGRGVLVVGHQKGRTTKEKVYRNFGMTMPEGNRKALRLMSLAERMCLPIITFVDTPGAYPGIGAEERGQAEAIAKNILVMSRLKVPIIVCIIGEGGSGGALALGVGDRVLMLQFACYSVISPESCAAILWRDAGQAELEAKALQLTAEGVAKLKVVDQVIAEPGGGAHRDFQGAAENLKTAIRQALDELCKLDPEILLEQRYQRFRQLGVFFDASAVRGGNGKTPA
jgi:acetyl-CoA carboxylase carboxyl transferase subunit alpha